MLQTNRPLTSLRRQIWTWHKLWWHMRFKHHQVPTIHWACPVVAMLWIWRYAAGTVPHCRRPLFCSTCDLQRRLHYLPAWPQPHYSGSRKLKFGCWNFASRSELGSLWCGEGEWEDCEVGIEQSLTRGATVTIHIALRCQFLPSEIGVRMQGG